MEPLLLTIVIGFILLFFLLWKTNILRFKNILKINISSKKVNKKNLIMFMFSLKSKFDCKYLEQRLLKLLYGDRKAARRLIEQAKKKNPGRSEKWYYEKVIDDLQCDRR
jgi:hypothetical protein